MLEGFIEGFIKALFASIFMSIISYFDDRHILKSSLANQDTKRENRFEYKAKIYDRELYICQRSYLLKDYANDDLYKMLNKLKKRKNESEEFYKIKKMTYLYAIYKNKTGIDYDDFDGFIKSNYSGKDATSKKIKLFPNGSWICPKCKRTNGNYDICETCNTNRMDYID